ncbi:RNA polymerase sigma factor SigJ [Occultella kanbiaonis]|uniref:RNA polymerase sigma factor SigJ n=1 Tax=Occultella kanbiaonis TaxID=2675754 RepID=UPI001E3A75D9|nr:RNA polymerase sigma factor SigJ [Occultella kanbiaonis]
MGLDVEATHDRLRPLMFAIAYRMLGSVTEAEDVVQEGFARLHGARDIESVEAYATTVTTRLAIDALRSARVRRERYVGSWLPEPLVTAGAPVASGTSPAPDPADVAVRRESLSVAVLMLMEELGPVERAVYVLREAVGLDYPRIGEIVERSPQACRQVYSRARRRLAAASPPDGAAADRRSVAEALVDALHREDVAGVEALLAADVRFHADGGGRAPAIAQPLEGAEAVARFLLGLARRGARFGLQLDVIEANGGPALRARGADGAWLAVMAVQVAGGRVMGLQNQLNPDKLAHLGPVGDLAALMAGAPRRTPSGRRLRTTRRH